MIIDNRLQVIGNIIMIVITSLHTSLHSRTVNVLNIFSHHATFLSKDSFHTLLS